MVASENELKNARVRTKAGGTRKTAMTCFNQRKGITTPVSIRVDLA